MQKQDKELYCWSCKEKGHTKAQCQKLLKHRGDMYCQHSKMAGHEIENYRKLGNREFYTHCKIHGHDVKACRKLAALSVNMKNDEQQGQSVNMTSATFSRGWCTAITSAHEPMLTMEVLVSLIDGGTRRSKTVTVLADTGASLCIMNSTAWSRIAHRSKLRKSNAVIGLADQNYELKTLGEAECDIILKNSLKSATQTVEVVETARY